MCGREIERSFVYAVFLRSNVGTGHSPRYTLAPQDREKSSFYSPMAGHMNEVTPHEALRETTPPTFKVSAGDGDAKQISCHSHHEFKGFKGYSSGNTARWKHSLCAHGSLIDWRDNLLLTDCVRLSIQGAEPAC